MDLLLFLLPMVIYLLLLINSGYSGGSVEQSSIQVTDNNSTVVGDLNNDNELNILDVVLLVQFTLQQQVPSDIEFYQSDLNDDGNINVLDVVGLINLILYNL